MVMVLCAKYYCYHLGCHDGPFLVAFVVSNMVEKTIFATVYSFVTTEWSKMIFVENLNAVITYSFGTILHLCANE